VPRKTAEEKRAETRARLVDAAMTTFLSRGYHAASLEEISELAGYSTGAIYSNFDGKEDLFLACSARYSERQTRVWDDFITEIEKQGAAPERFGEVLVTVLPAKDWTRALVEFQLTAASESSKQALCDNQRRWLGIVTRLLEAFCAGNGLTPDIPIEAAAASVVATVDGLRFNALLDRDTDVVGIVSTTLHALLGTSTPTASTMPRNADS
jgi:AcrR family transcriptional regulator